jgi:hypothetical protein
LRLSHAADRPSAFYSAAVVLLEQMWRSARTSVR